MAYEHPIAKVINTCQDGDTIQTTIQLNRTTGLPIAPALIYSNDEPKQLLLELHRLIAREDDKFVFETYDENVSPLNINSTYIYIPLWSKDQLEIAQSSSERWHKEQFKEQDMVTFSSDDGSVIGRKVEQDDEIGNGTIVPGGWDHEHCELCYKTISAIEGYDSIAYTDKKNWVCEQCYEKYILSGFGLKMGEAS